MSGYLWIKSFHILFVASWFAGLFYLPRIFVNLAMETEPAAIARLLVMARKLYKFMTLLAIPALLLGFMLVGVYKIGTGGHTGWLHAKILVVLLIVGYHHGCGRLLKKFERQANTRSHVFYRWFNEIPVVLMAIAIILVVVKPF
ncbi:MULTISPECIES: CopD family protein [Limnobacter]|uniref:Protoporphyrinogen IX oxidase n=1 Tax=Limnobacter litoralis TaxID=481366 RepID=A0ABQ5YN56_9BURK|nr:MULTISPECIES: CopD family protein [Limnobacter]GLR26004.1 membrane protein [Limnobacter litoralis]HEX5487131.1 CopD family protein [Limnobacter sp.]